MLRFPKHLHDKWIYSSLSYDKSPYSKLSCELSPVWQMAILAAHASHRPLTDYGEVTACLGAGTLGHDGHWMLDIVCVLCSSCHLQSLHSEHLGCALHSYFQVVHGKQIKVNVTNNFSNLLVSHNQATFLQSFPTPFYVPESEPPAVSAFHVVP